MILTVVATCSRNRRIVHSEVIVFDLSWDYCLTVFRRGGLQCLTLVLRTNEIQSTSTGREPRWTWEQTRNTELWRLIQLGLFRGFSGSHFLMRGVCCCFCALLVCVRVAFSRHGMSSAAVLSLERLYGVLLLWTVATRRIPVSRRGPVEYRWSPPS